MSPAEIPSAFPSQPCDRTRRVFTESRGEISDGPPGSNYTQVSQLNALTFSLFGLVTGLFCLGLGFTLRVADQS